MRGTASLLLLLASTAPLLADRWADFETCTLRTPGTEVRIEAKCTEIEVPLDREQPALGRLALRVAVLPAVERGANPDPLFFLAGGPGQAATETWGLMASALAGVNRDRDIVLVDQRGTGSSAPLDCPPSSPTESLSEEEAKARMEECREALGVDLSLFTTAHAVEDLEEVRRRLGFPNVNVLGVSYGTRVAQRWARAYPRSVRTLILDGVVPLDFAVGQTLAADADRSLAALFQRCRRDPACDEAFPDLAARFEEWLIGLDQSPRTIEVPNPSTTVKETVTLDRPAITQIVRFLTYSTEASVLLPLFIDRSIGGEPEVLLAQGLIAGEAVLEGMSEGMAQSVLCAEDAPFVDLERIEAEAEGTYLGSESTRLLLAVCEVWPSGREKDEERLPWKGATPTLLLSGQNDPVTPPVHAERVAAGLERARHVVVPEMGHNVVARGCIPDLVEEFLATADPAALDPSCVESIEAMPFFLDESGPAP